MAHFFKDREDVARFVSGRIRRLQSGSVLTIIIEAAKSGACSVSSVTDTLSDGIQMADFSKGLDVT